MPREKKKEARRSKKTRRERGKGRQRQLLKRLALLWVVSCSFREMGRGVGEGYLAVGVTCVSTSVCTNLLPQVSG